MRDFLSLRLATAAILITFALLWVTSADAVAKNSHSIDLELDSSQYLSISDASQTGLDVTGDLTIEAWVKPESTGIDRTVVAKWGAEKSYAFVLQNGTVSIDIAEDPGSQDQSMANTLLVTGQWQHIAVTLDTSIPGGTVTHYLNGEVDGQKSNMGNVIFDSITPFRISAQDQGTSHFFDGKIDEVRVWNDVRTAAEIRTHRFKQLEGTEANLVGYWALDGDLLDQTSNNNDLTNNNGASFSQDVPFFPVPAISTLGLLILVALFLATGLATRQRRSIGT